MFVLMLQSCSAIMTCDDSCLSLCCRQDGGIFNVPIEVITFVVVLSKQNALTYKTTTVRTILKLISLIYYNLCDIKGQGNEQPEFHISL